MAGKCSAAPELLLGSKQCICGMPKIICRVCPRAVIDSSDSRTDSGVTHEPSWSIDRLEELLRLTMGRNKPFLREK